MRYVLLSARHTGHLLQDSASLLQPRGEGGDGQLTGVGVNVVHGGRVLAAVSKVASHGGEIIQADGNFLHSATRSLMCIIQQGDCDSQVRKHRGQKLQRKTKSQVKDRIDDDVAHGIFHITLDWGGQILSAATNILTDIAFIKIKILQGLFSNPDCWESAKNDKNGCISQLCNDTEQRQKIYIDNFGQCLGQARKWIIDSHL